MIPSMIISVFIVIIPIVSGRNCNFSESMVLFATRPGLGTLIGGTSNVCLTQLVKTRKLLAKIPNATMKSDFFMDIDFIAIVLF